MTAYCLSITRTVRLFGNFSHKKSPPLLGGSICFTVADTGHGNVYRRADNCLWCPLIAHYLVWIAQKVGWILFSLVKNIHATATKTTVVTTIAHTNPVNPTAICRIREMTKRRASKVDFTSKIVDFMVESPLRMIFNSFDITRLKVTKPSILLNRTSTTMKSNKSATKAFTMSNDKISKNLGGNVTFYSNLLRQLCCYQY